MRLSAAGVVELGRPVGTCPGTVDRGHQARGGENEALGRVADTRFC